MNCFYCWLDRDRVGDLEVDLEDFIWDFLGGGGQVEDSGRNFLRCFIEPS